MASARIEPAGQQNLDRVDPAAGGALRAARQAAGGAGTLLDHGIPAGGVRVGAYGGVVAAALHSLAGDTDHSAVAAIFHGRTGLPAVSGQRGRLWAHAPRDGAVCAFPGM